MPGKSNKITNKQSKNCYLVMDGSNFMYGAFHRTPNGHRMAEEHAKRLEIKNKEKYFVK